MNSNPKQISNLKQMNHKNPLPKKLKLSQTYQFNHDDEWYTTLEDVTYFIERAQIPKDKIIWCPFDKETSNFVIGFKNAGYKVIHSHISNNQDFYSYQPESWDVIVSNPPFRNKATLLTRLLEIAQDKPWALIFEIQAFNTGSFTRLLTQFSNISYVNLIKRMKFVRNESNYDLSKLPQPTFHSLWICNKMWFDKSINIWEGVNYVEIVKKMMHKNKTKQ